MLNLNNSGKLIFVQPGVYISDKDVPSQFDTFFIQAFFGRRSTGDDVGRIVESTNDNYKLRVLMKKKINKRMEVVSPEVFEK